MVYSVLHLTARAGTMIVTPQVHNDDGPALSRVTPRSDASTHMKFLGQDVATPNTAVSLCISEGQVTVWQ